jgi:hypothetical protein
MGQKTLFEKLGVKYEERNGLFYPLITLDIMEDDVNVGKYGHMWMQYLKSEYPQRYRSLVRFGELKHRVAEVNEVAYELLEDIEKEWLQKHRPKNKNSFMEMYRLRTEARLMAEKVVLHDVVNCFH